MKRQFSLGFVFAVIALVIVSGVAFGAQWLQTMSLRTELESARGEVRELERLRAENVRLRGQQLPSAQLEALRADHAALPRLRAELEALNKPPAP